MKITSNIDIASKPAVNGRVADYAENVVEALEETFCPLIIGCAKGEFTLRLSDNAEVQALNKKFRNKDKPTNVLSFSYVDNFSENIANDLFFNDKNGAPIYLGDIIISCEILQEEALQQNKSLEHHLQHLLLHGILHICGFDHITDGEAKIMEDLEVLILEQLGIGNPYKNINNIGKTT